MLVTRARRRKGLYLLCLLAPSVVQAQVDSSSVAVAAKATAVLELIAGDLPAKAAPQALFDVSLDDEAAVDVERTRLEILLGTVDAPPKRGSSPPPAAADPARWSAQMALDRARLRYLQLPAGERNRLQTAHAQRREAAAQAQAAALEAQQRLDAAHRQELEASRLAQAEARRLLENERLLLAKTATAVERTTTRFRAEREALEGRAAIVLGWHRRAVEAQARGGQAADELYDALRVALKASRDELDASLREVRSATSAVPRLESDPQGLLGSIAAADEAVQDRDRLLAQIQEAKAEEERLRYLRAEALLYEVRALNDDRLTVLEALSEDKRRRLTGFTTDAADQARAEARHLLLTLRYDRLAAQRWLEELSASRGAFAVFWGATPWLILGIVGAWARRKVPSALLLANRRVEAESSPPWVVALVGLLQQVGPSTGRLLVFGAAVWLIPADVRAVLEVQLLTVVVGWILVGGLLIRTINALALANSSGGSDVEALRLRSLRLVGRVVVLFLLVRRAAAALVGEGTTYAWVGSLSGLGGVLVVVVLVLWWREVVFARIARRRRKSTVQRWVIEHQRGWTTFPAALVGILELVGASAVRVARRWLGRFDLARKGLAYLFKREIDRLAEAAPVEQHAPLSPKELATLSPERIAPSWVACAAERPLKALLGRAALGRGGVVAVIGPRGAGKSSLLRQFVASSPTPVRHLGEGVGPAEAMQAAMVPGPDATIVVWDDAHRLIKPILGGFDPFDRVLAHAYGLGAGTLWVMAIDSVLWPLLRRARDARPLFEEVYFLEPWTEAELGRLLELRSQEAEILASYEGLLDKLPPSADEIDREEALAARQLGYLRMLWDYSRGNPGVALDVWRRSLTAPQGGDRRSLVRPLQVPNEQALEALPDTALFILRAILQLAPASPSDIAAATRLPEAEVRMTLEVGTSRQYLELVGDRVQIGWSWLRPIQVLLERRHLLVSR